MKNRKTWWPWGLMVVCFIVGVVSTLCVCRLVVDNLPEPDPVVVVVESAFDTSVIDGWCGGPVGRIRMVGAWYYEDGVFEDETGNLWAVDCDIDPEGFYLLWLDDLGDDVVQNDEIIKVWQEK